MTEKRQTYTAEFKREAVRLVTEHGYNVAEAARNLGINAHMLRRWKCQCEAQVQGAFPGKGRLSPEHAELYRLQSARGEPEWVLCLYATPNHSLYRC